MTEYVRFHNTELSFADENNQEIDIGTHLTVKKSKSPTVLEFDLNRNLDSIDALTIFGYTRQFLSNSESDFRLLATQLQSEEFEQIVEIFGIGVFPEAMGKRFGFQSEIYSTNQKLIAKFLKQTPKKSLLGSDHSKKALRRFSISREDFIQKYSNS